MTKVVFKGVTVYEYVVCVQDYKFANAVPENVFQIDVKKMQVHWSVQRVLERIGRVRHVWYKLSSRDCPPQLQSGDIPLGRQGW